MIINRRNFVQRAACVAAVAPVLANLGLMSHSAQSDTSLPAEPTAEREAAAETATSNPLFKIHGWDWRQNNGVDETQSTFISEADNDGRVVIRVMQSWRTAWR
jgi:hypothetical protein